MKSKSPFSKNTPLKEIEIFQGSTSTYRHPSTVIQPIVGAKVGKKLAETGGKVAVDAINAMPGKKPEFKVPEFEKPELKLPEYKGDLRTIGGFEERTIQGKGKANRTFFKDLSTKQVKEAKKWIKENPKKYKELLNKKNKTTSTTEKRTYTLVNGKKVYDTGWMAKNNSLAINMNGSPAKQIDPYAAINPEAVPGAQAQNVLGAQPIVGANLNQARNVDMQAMIDPYKSPGATFKPGEKLKAENIYGQAGQRQALMNLGSPMHAHTPDHDKKSDSLAMKGPLYHKGHPDDYDGHTHRKIGKSYEVGDYMDQTDMDKKFPKLWSEDVGRIQKDKVSQFMISKNKDYNPTKIDTKRPVSGKTFKMTWGDAERNISTNPKYKKSK